MKRPRVLLAEDHRIVAEGLKSLLAADFDLVGVVEDGRALIETAGRLRPDVIVADISMPELNGIEALEALRRDGLEIPVVFLTMHRDVAYARRALESGAAGYVLKHSAASELLQGVRAALDGGTYVSPALAGKVFEAMKAGPAGAPDPVSRLTPRQREVLQLLARGLSAKEVAAKVDISPRTVEFHKYQMMEALGAKSSAELIRLAIRHGIAEE
ncbi:MAG TPA: response regulator transcription factor [Burkholderiaceae bacterium]|nr:response regulator transcription factor [Burkholderiaceae bacterium]HQR70796.1 response regulator transcription factor [Burkholderiaceae bacterium]